MDCRLPRRCLHEETSGSPRFLGNPRSRAAVVDPGAAGQLKALDLSDVAFRRQNDVGPHHAYISGLSMRLTSSLPWASRRTVTVTTCQFASGWLPALAGRGSHPRGSKRASMLVVSQSPCLLPGLACRTLPGTLYWRFHLDREQHRVHESRYADPTPPQTS